MSEELPPPSVPLFLPRGDKRLSKASECLWSGLSRRAAFETADPAVRLLLYVAESKKDKTAKGSIVGIMLAPATVTQPGSE
jgi:hypothetical protein